MIGLLPPLACFASSSAFWMLYPPAGVELAFDFGNL
jgi:hypothetical protein